MSARKDAHENGRSIRTSWRTLLEIVLRAPDVQVPVLLSTGGAIWCVHAGPFPAGAMLERSPLAGSVIVAALWLSVYASVGHALIAAVRDVEPRLVLRRLAIAMLVFVILCVPLVLAEAPPLVRLRYLKPLWWLSAALATAAACFPHVLGSIWRASGT